MYVKIYSKGQHSKVRCMEINVTEMIRTTGALTELDLLYKRLIYSSK